MYVNQKQRFILVIYRLIVIGQNPIFRSLSFAARAVFSPDRASRPTLVSSGKKAAVITVSSALHKGTHQPLELD